MKNRRRIFALLLALVLCLPACGGAAEETMAEETAAPETQGAAESEEVQEIAGIETETLTEPVEIAVLKGPTGMGMAYLFGHEEEGYRLSLFEAPDQVTAKLLSGEIDVAAVPSNLGAVLYNKTEGGISVIDINTLGVLNVETGDESIQQFADLAGKTVYMTGKGATPEYAMNFLLNKAGIADQVTLEFKSEPTEVVQALSADATAVGVLPQPFATAACVKNEALKAVIDLTDVWTDSVDDGSQLLTGVTVVRNEFLAEHPEAVAEFIAQQAASVDAANADPAAVAPLVVSAGIIDAEPVAAKAIPSCHLVCITGTEMQSALSGYLQTLFDSDPASVGGTLPADDFYFLG